MLSAASRLLTNAGSISEVSTRAVADAVGVSPMAIYLHFADKQALLDAVVAGVVAELDDVMRSAAGDADDPLAALCAEVSAYVQFAVERPTHYRYATRWNSGEREPVGTNSTTSLLNPCKGGASAPRWPRASAPDSSPALTRTP